MSLTALSTWGNLPVPPDPLHWSAGADRRLRRPSVDLRLLTADDWTAVAEIYWDGMRDTLFLERRSRVPG